MYALRLAPALIVITAVFGASSAARADCTCRALGKLFELGQRICLTTPTGPRLATCGMVLNNVSWELSKEPCVAAQFNRRAPQARADMRKLPARWTGRFDAVVNLFTSFGFFADPNDDAQVIRECARVLKPGGLMVWQGGSRDGVMAKFLASDWWDTRDGTIIGQDREFDPLTGFITIRSTWRRGRKVEQREHRIRLYTASRLAELMLDAEQVVLGVVDERQRCRRARGQLAGKLRAHAASRSGHEQPSSLERTAIECRQHALYRPPEQSLLGVAVQLHHDEASRITMSTRWLRARFSGVSFATRG